MQWSGVVPTPTACHREEESKGLREEVVLEGTGYEKKVANIY